MGPEWASLAAQWGLFLVLGAVAGVLAGRLGVAMASVLAAPWGTRLAHRLSGDALRRVFAGFLLVVALALIVGR